MSVSAHADWYRTFFRGLALDLWRAVVPPELTRAEADFLVRELGLRDGAPVLDVPCGDGRHALELAARGLRVTGVDLSPGQIASARERGARAGAAVEWRLADMRDLPRSAAFDGACCMGTRGAEVQRQTGLQWVWTRHELRALLERCALRPRAENASIAGDPWTEAAPSLLLVAQRA